MFVLSHWNNSVLGLSLYISYTGRLEEWLTKVTTSVQAEQREVKTTLTAERQCHTDRLIGKKSGLAQTIRSSAG